MEEVKDAGEIPSIPDFSGVMNEMVWMCFSDLHDGNVVIQRRVSISDCHHYVGRDVKEKVNVQEILNYHSFLSIQNTCVGMSFYDPHHHGGVDVKD